MTALYGASGVAAADVATLRDGDIVVATPEKLDFALRIDPSVLDDVGLIVLDEGHMIGLGTREIRYEVLVQRLLRRADAVERRIVCLSAVFGPRGAAAESASTDGSAAAEESPEYTGSVAFGDFAAWLRNDAAGTPITSGWRPTRQRSGHLRWGVAGGRLELTVDGERPYVPRFVQPEAPIGRRKRIFPKDANEFVLATAKAFLADNQRVLIYCPRRQSVETLASTLLMLERQGYLSSLLSPEADISRALRVGREWLGDEHVALKALQKGVAVHHGTLPRPFLAEIEDLLHRRVLPLVISSPTLAQGLDLSCGVLIFRSIYRYRDQVIPTEEFANVMGRAGRAFVDLDGITVLPVFESGGAGQRRIDAYHKLLDDSSARRLESGLVLLVEKLVRLLALGLNATPDAVRDYVLDVVSTWEVGVADIDEDGRDRGDALAPALAELDAALLSSVDDLACPLASLADALDAALRSSLWDRRLHRRPDADARLARDVILGRVRWLWSRTTPAQRRGYHAAGVGYEAGRYLDANQSALVAHLRSAEAALITGELDKAAAAVIEVARALRTIAPFAFEHAGVGWELVLSAWFRGEPVTSVRPATPGGTGIPFIQHDVVYRLVWGVEAVRVHAAQTGATEPGDLTGAVAAVLTYGVPTPAGIVLAQAGLPSREMINRLLKAFTSEFTSIDGLRFWLRNHRAPTEVPGFWPDPAATAIWSAFLQRWSDAARERWSDRRGELSVEWLPGCEVPGAGTQVTLVRDASDGVTYVCDHDLSPLGRLTDVPTGIIHGSVAARVDRTQQHLVVDSFGP